MSFELSDRQPGSSERLLSVELRRESKQCGLLLLQVPEELQLSAQQLDLLRTLSAALANLLHGTHRAQLSHRLALHDERATIARELHDSLAQSLSYLKIQASRLQSLLHGSQNLQLDRLEIDNIAEEMRANLNRAYRQLRELITTCRLTMNGKTIGQALLDSVEEFEKRSTMTFDLDNRLTDDMLTVDQEMQVLHIVREAMTNVVRHAQASFVKVSLHCPDHDEIVVSIADDGIGIEAPREGEQHYGLLIMQERAHKLGGNLRLEQNPSGGTHVLVSFSREPVL
jgi:two-component system nitrate/nitrite sensor histidine kinase NarX